MRILILSLLVIVAASAEAAEPLPWPKKTDLKVEFVQTPPDQLPKGFRFEQISAEGREPHPVGIYWLDLNRDATPELIVDSHEGGTGGTFKNVFVQTRTGFRLIGGWMGGISILPLANGYHQIESWSSAGGGQYNRSLYRYEGARYHLVRLEDWRGTDTEAGYEFVRKRDPKEFDRE